MTHSIFYDEVDNLLNNNKDNLNENDEVLINMYGFDPEQYFHKSPLDPPERLLEEYLRKCYKLDIKVSMYNLSEEIFDKYFKDWGNTVLAR